jgi:hypothetical protein
MTKNNEDKKHRTGSFRHCKRANAIVRRTIGSAEASYAIHRVETSEYLKGHPFVGLKVENGSIRVPAALDWV